MEEEFLASCEDGNEHLISSSLINGLNPNFEYKKNTPLNKAIESDNLQIVNVLINAGANVNFPVSNKEKAILKSAWFGNVEILKILISNGANPYELDRTNFSVVCRASEYANEKFLKTLIESGGKSFDYCGCESNMTPLMHASYKGKTDIVEMLLSKDVNVNSVNLNGQTALMLACGEGKTKTVELLLQSGANLNIGVNKQHYDYGKGYSTCPLNMAASKGHIEIVRLLLTNGAIPDVKGEKDGKTALHLSALEEHYQIVKELIAAGANIYQEDNYGSTIFSLAKENGVLQQLENVIGKTQQNKSNKQWSFDTSAIVNSIISALQKMQVSKIYKSFEVDEGVCYIIDKQGDKTLLIELEEKDGFDFDLYHEDFHEYKASMLVVFEKLKSSEAFKNMKLNNIEFILSEHIT